MKRLLPLLFLFIAAQSITSQDIQFYTNAKGDKHITGSFPIDYLKKDSLYSKWFLKSYDEFSMPTVDTSWKKRLKIFKWISTWVLGVEIVKIGFPNF